MNIKKQDILLLINVLRNTKKLSLSDARIRDRWIKQLLTAGEELDKERQVIIHEVSNKDEEGNPVRKKILDDNYKPIEVFDIEKANFQRLEEEIDTLMNETVDIIGDVEILRQLVDKTSYEFEYREPERLDLLLADPTPAPLSEPLNKESQD